MYRITHCILIIEYNAKHYLVHKNHLNWKKKKLLLEVMNQLFINATCHQRASNIEYQTMLQQSILWEQNATTIEYHSTAILTTESRTTNPMHTHVKKHATFQHLAAKAQHTIQCNAIRFTRFQYSTLAIGDQQIKSSVSSTSHIHYMNSYNHINTIDHCNANCTIISKRATATSTLTNTSCTAN